MSAQEKVFLILKLILKFSKLPYFTIQNVSIQDYVILLLLDYNNY